MKKFLILASHIANRKVEIEAKDLEEALQIANKSGKTLFDSTIEAPNWQVDHVAEVGNSPIN